MYLYRFRHGSQRNSSLTCVLIIAMAIYNYLYICMCINCSLSRASVRFISSFRCCRVPSATSIRGGVASGYERAAVPTPSHGALRHSTGSYHASTRAPARAPVSTTTASQQHASQTVMSLVLNQSSPDAVAQTKLQSAR